MTKRGSGSTTVGIRSATPTTRSGTVASLPTCRSSSPPASATAARSGLTMAGRRRPSVDLRRPDDLGRGREDLELVRAVVGQAVEAVEADRRPAQLVLVAGAGDEAGVAEDERGQQCRPGRPPGGAPRRTSSSRRRRPCGSSCWSPPSVATMASRRSGRPVYSRSRSSVGRGRVEAMAPDGASRRGGSGTCRAAGQLGRRRRREVRAPARQGRQGLGRQADDRDRAAGMVGTACRDRPARAVRSSPSAA